MKIYNQNFEVYYELHRINNLCKMYAMKKDTRTFKVQNYVIATFTFFLNLLFLGIQYLQHLIPDSAAELE